MEAPRGGAGLSTRSRELGIVFGDAPPGEQDAITDVAGVQVGSVTLVEGEDVRTGVTAIVPSEADVGEHQLFAGCHTLNGNGELAFSTARQDLPPSGVADASEPVTVPVTMLVESHITPLYHATIEATEAAIVNAPLAAETTTGRRGVTAHGLEPERLLEAMGRFGAG